MQGWQLEYTVVGGGPHQKGSHPIEGDLTQIEAINTANRFIRGYDRRQRDKSPHSTEFRTAKHISVATLIDKDGRRTTIRN